MATNVFAFLWKFKSLTALLAVILFYEGIFFLKFPNLGTWGPVTWVIEGEVGRRVRVAGEDLVSKAEHAALQVKLEAETKRAQSKAKEAQKARLEKLQISELREQAVKKIEDLAKGQKEMVDEIAELENAPPANDCRVSPGLYNRLRNAK